MANGAYARSGVDTSRAGGALAGLVEVLGSIDTGKPSRAVLGSGHYANVLRLTDTLGIAISTDGVGSKVIVAEQLGRFDTVGIDCVAMNANDLVCVGAEPIALVDYIAVEETDAEVLRQIAVGLKAGAEQAGVEIPGGELAQLPELIRGHPSPRGFDLVGACFGVVELDAIVTGERIEPGDALIGFPASGVHSNGLTLARSVLTDVEERPPELRGRSVGEELLLPTAMYVRAALELLSSDVDVRGLAHITGDGLLNLLRLSDSVGFRVDSPLPVPPVFELIAERGEIAAAEMHEVFNMGCGFVCVVPAGDADAAVALLGAKHPGAARIGAATDAAGTVELPQAGLEGDGEGLRPTASPATERAELSAAADTPSAFEADRNLQIVRRLYEQFRARDNSGPFEVYDPEIVWEMDPAWGTPGFETEYRGHEGVRRYWRQWLGAWAEIEFEVEELAAAGDAVVARMWQRNRGRESGIWVEQGVDGRWAQIWRLRGGMVVRARATLARDVESLLAEAGFSEEDRANTLAGQAALRAISSGDLDAALALLDPNVEWTPIQVEWEGQTFHGRDEVGQWLENDLWQAFEEVTWEPRESVKLGDTWLTTGVRRTRGSGSGAEVENTFAHLSRWRDGLCIRLRSFATREEAVTAAPDF